MTIDKSERSDIALLHGAVLRNEVGAADRLAALLLRRLLRVVRRRLRGVDAGLINDAIEDTILKYLASPSTYEPHRSGLETFLVVVSINRTLDLLRQESRRHLAERRAAIPRDALVSRSHEGRDDRAVNEGARLFGVIARTPIERRFLAARLADEHRVAELARLLDASGLPPEEQRRIVKNMTEKLRMRARRLSLDRPRLDRRA